MAGIILDVMGKDVNIGDNVLFTTYGDETMIEGTVMRETPKSLVIVGDGNYNHLKAMINKGSKYKSQRVYKL